MTLHSTDDYSRNFTFCSTHVLIWRGTMDLRAESEATRQHLGVSAVFDRDLTVNGIIDLDMPSVWAAACNSASDLMRKATEIARNCYPCATGSEHHPWCASRAEARMLRQLAYSIMAPFRIAISERTEDERAVAWSSARLSVVRMFQGGAAVRECDSCLRPLWQHIEHIGGRIICPFGREYWAYLNAIDAHGRGVTQDDSRSLASIIARPTEI